MLASILSVVVFYAKPAVPSVWRTPSGLTDSCDAVAMLVIGSTLALIPIKGVFGEVRLYPLAAVKLLAAPVLTWLVLSLFITTP
jgi:hypothetical protein